MNPKAIDDELLAEATALDVQYIEAANMPAEQYERDLLALVEAAKTLLMNRTPDMAAQLEFQLKQTLEQFEPWLEQDDDPRSMGWVDDRGRP